MDLKKSSHAKVHTKNDNAEIALQIDSAQKIKILARNPAPNWGIML